MLLRRNPPLMCALRSGLELSCGSGAACQLSTARISPSVVFESTHWCTRPATLLRSAAKHQALGPFIASGVGRFPRTGIGPFSTWPLPSSVQPALPRFYPQYRSGISIGRNAVFPAFLQQLPASRCMTVIRATKAVRKPYPYQSTLSQSYRRQSRAASSMNASPDVKPVISSYANSSAAHAPTAPAVAPPTSAPPFRMPTHHHFDVGGLPTPSLSLTAAALAPVLEDIYFDSNGVLFRNGVAIVDQHGSIICRPIAERPLPVFRPTFVDPETSVLRTNRAVIGQHAHRIAPPFFDPLPAFIESRSDAAVSCSDLSKRSSPTRLESLVEHLHHNGQAPAANNSAVDSSGDAQMRPASETRSRLTGDPA
ncbi:hypothetical protein PCANC_03978 [Puccinia coronata f. sp. avenae]|uniref:Uncharacterized protein n=1 Tax=Puccinia coronata f. sp. avenae TaxID=200324 RepID=A0A2N5T7X4_9BASI|nr:hypothetical protein PCANC_03978 [Puccinia coronata f. sp. avenae]